jgi:hypothetical protein
MAMKAMTTAETPWLHGQTAPERKKHLLRLLVEKVLIQDRCTFAVWYRLPQFPAVRTLSHLVAPKCLYANLLRRASRRTQARTVFLLAPRHGYGPESQPGAHVRTMERGIRPWVGSMVHAPQDRLRESALTVG